MNTRTAVAAVAHRDPLDHAQVLAVQLQRHRLRRRSRRRRRRRAGRRPAGRCRARGAATARPYTGSRHRSRLRSSPTTVSVERRVEPGPGRRPDGQPAEVGVGVLVGHRQVRAADAAGRPARPSSAQATRSRRFAASAHAAATTFRSPGRRPSKRVYRSSPTTRVASASRPMPAENVNRRSLASPARPSAASRRGWPRPPARRPQRPSGEPSWRANTDVAPAGTTAIARRGRSPFTTSLTVPSPPMATTTSALRLAPPARSRAARARSGAARPRPPRTAGRATASTSERVTPEAYGFAIRRRRMSLALRYRREPVQPCEPTRQSPASPLRWW